jgi:hypothetical protein
MKLQLKTIIIILLILFIGVIGWGILTMPDQRTTGEKIGDAVDALPEGADKAVRQLEDRTPGERLGDAVEDVGEDIRENTDEE